ncbi:hypothetical protein [Agarilytica rhodophyticola]|uniref:hypothetical protein n=1 Tax=Agarilytica rhodophyticola TaxID=1737490 RepID=UPI000B346B7E|nr:hypothetical protein [Agarilytica rhodophyticola]
MKEFNDKAAYPPKQKKTRGKAHHAQEKSMVEQEQPVPVLKPKGMEEVDRTKYRTRLTREHNRVERLNEKAQQLYHKSLSQVQQAAANKQRHSAIFNAQTDRTVLPPLHRDQAKGKKKVLTKEEEAAEKYKDYINILSDLKRYYQGIEKLQRSASTMMTYMRGSADMLNIANDVSESAEIMLTSVRHLHHKKREIEKSYPEFQEKAKIFGKTLNRIQEKRMQQSL